MKIKKLLIVLVLAVALLGCGKRQPRQFVVLPDVSGSIDRQSLEQAFKAIDDVAGHLQRGDRLTIIPIMGDAEAETSGKILRFEVPANRQAYDTDLRDFRSKLNSSLKEMRANAVKHPGSKTDIIGSISLAEQEFHLVTSSKQLLIILSDFIQEDQNFNFQTDKHLENIANVQQFAFALAKNDNGKLNSVAVYLGLLRSNEYARLDQSRRYALKEFWIQYLRNIGGVPQLATDGPGLMRIIQ